MSEQPHDDHAPIREAVRALCADFPGEYWRALDRDRGYPTEFVAALTKAGFLAALIPEQYGGSGLPMCGRGGDHGGDPCRPAATAPPAMRRCTPWARCCGTATPTQKERYLPAIAERRTAAAGVRRHRADVRHRHAEPAHHRGARRQRLRRQRPEDLDLARRAFRPDAAARAHHAARAGRRSAPTGCRSSSSTCAAAKGLTIRPIRTMMNHATTEIFFDDMRVPAENLIGEEGEGFRYILSGMNAERILIAAECIGDARWFIDKATAYAKERSVFGRPIGQNQGVQFPIARAYAQMRTAALMVREAASLYDAGRDCGAEANMAKLAAADASWAAAEMCVQTHGGFGFAEEFDIERKFRETRLYQVAPISTNLILSYLAEHVLGCRRVVSEVGDDRCRSKACSSSRSNRRSPRRCAPAGSPMPARASSRSSARRATSRAAMTMSRTASRAISSGSTAARSWWSSISRKADDKALLAAMLAKADVFVQNLKPGAVAKLGFPIERLRREHPRLIVCSVSGYGESGPYAERKAYDLLIQAEVGLASITGGPIGAGARRRLGVRHRRRHERLRGDPRSADRARAHRRGRRAVGLAVRRDGRLDDDAAAAAGRRQAAEARRPRAHLDRALRRVQEPRRRRRADLDPERPRMARAGANRCSPTRRSRTIRTSPAMSSG